MDYTALKAELVNDPVGLGYAPHRWGNSSALAALLNAPRAGAADVWNPGVDTDKLRSRVAKSDYVALSADDRAFLAFLLGGDSLDTSLAQVQTDAGALFPAGSATRTAWLAVARRKPSRAEELWGVGTVIRVSDVDAARDA